MSVVDLYSKTLNEYLDLAASRSPTPGGGSVSAVSATNAAAMVSMVANLTVGKKGYEGAQEQAKRILAEATSLIGELKKLTGEDIAAFDAFMAAWRLPSGSDAEKTAKEAAMEQAAQTACRVPVAICRACLRVLAAARELAPIGNKTAISDVGVALYVADAALRAAMLSVDINIPLIKTDSFVAEVRAERSRLLSEAEELKIVGLGIVKTRLA
jgi:formiminotetrahydrofolate cyclodeaminase